MKLPFTTVDVFTTTRYLGNPLAIVRVPFTSLLPVQIQILRNSTSSRPLPTSRSQATPP
jgi:hypothetical protein